jgi:hypothetical protein
MVIDNFGKKIKSISFLGRGNVAMSMSEIFKKAGYNVVQLWRRGEEIADADLYIICVPDSAIKEVADKLKPDSYWVHTSANFDEGSLKKFKHKGVFYPFQTFTKGVDVCWDHLPIFINSDDSDFTNDLINIAKSISDNVCQCDRIQLSNLHVAAVFGCNFTNHLCKISADILQENDMDFDIIKPLLLQTFKKFETLTPSQAQTGPAIRKDKSTIRKQLQMLSPWHRKLYKMLTKSIQISKK